MEQILSEKDQQEPVLPTPSFPTFNLRRAFLNGFPLQRQRFSTLGLLRGLSKGVRENDKHVVDRAARHPSPCYGTFFTESCISHFGR